MNKTVRLAALAVLAFTLTCLALAGPIHHRLPGSNCVQRCASYCRSLGMMTYETCTSCYCYPPAGYGCYGCAGGCSGGCYGGCYGGGYGCGCGGYGCSGGGCGGGGCGGGGCGGGC